MLAQVNVHSRDGVDKDASKQKGQTKGGRMTAYFVDVPWETGIDPDSHERQAPQQMRFVQKSDGSSEALAITNCNTGLSGKKTKFIDFRFVVPSTKTPVTITVGPLRENGFLLLSRKPLPSEGHFDQRTFAAACEGDLARTHGTIHSMTLEEGAGKRFKVGMYYLSVCTGGDALSNLRVRLFIPAPGSPEIEYCWYGVRRRTRSANKVAEEAAHAQWMQTKEAITSKNISRKIAAAGLTRVAGQKVQANAQVLTPSVGLRVSQRKTTCVARRHRHQWWDFGGLPQHANIEEAKIMKKDVVADTDNPIAEEQRRVLSNPDTEGDQLQSKLNPAANFSNACEMATACRTRKCLSFASECARGICVHVRNCMCPLHRLSRPNHTRKHGPVQLWVGQRVANIATCQKASGKGLQIEPPDSVGLKRLSSQKLVNGKLGADDLWSRLSKPLLSSTRLNRSSRRKELSGKKTRPISAPLERSCTADLLPVDNGPRTQNNVHAMKPPQTEPRLNRMPASMRQSGQAPPRPISARPASVQQTQSTHVRQRPESAMARMHGYQSFVFSTGRKILDDTAWGVESSPTALRQVEKMQREETQPAAGEEVAVADARSPSQMPDRLNEKSQVSGNESRNASLGLNLFSGSDGESRTSTRRNAETRKENGVSADVLDFLMSLQSREQRRATSQSHDLMQQASGTSKVRLIIPNAETIDLEQITDLSDEVLHSMAQFGGSHITTLRLGDCNKVTLKAVAGFVRNFPLVSSISLNAHDSVDDDWLRELCAALDLQELSISGCTRITDSGLAYAVASSGGLRRLDCSYCDLVSDQSVLALAKWCTRLEGVNLRGCSRVPVSAFSTLFSSCQRLSAMNLSGLRAISSELFHPSIGFRWLQSLNVSNCRRFNDKGLQHLARIDTMQCLILHANTDVTDLGLSAIATWPKLAKLCLARCPRITDGGMLKVAQGCRQIKLLQVDFCVGISDTGVSFVADFCSELNHLSVRGCSQVTNVGVRCVLQHCRQLSALDIAHTGADEAEVRLAVSEFEQQRRSERALETTTWLVGDDYNWTDVDFQSGWAPDPLAIDCRFVSVKDGFVAREA